MTREKGKTMLKKIKILTMAIVMTFAILMPSVFVHAAEFSDKVIEVPQDGIKHTVIAFGSSIAIIYPDGKTDIIANNLSGRIDVMLDGEVIKGIGVVTVSAQNKANLVLETDSYLVSNISEQQANSFKKAITDALMKDAPISVFSAIENQDGMQGVNAFIIGNQGELQASDGTAASAGTLSGIQITTPEIAYQEFAEEMQESIRIEQEARQEEQSEEVSLSTDSEEKEDDSSESANGCNHNWELENGIQQLLLGSPDNPVACATPPFYRCTKCKILMWKNTHIHTEEKCEYCGHGGSISSSVCSNSEDGKHDWVEKQHYPGTSIGPIFLADYSRCYTGSINHCSLCSEVDLTNAVEHVHGDDFCEYCGYNKSGEMKN